MPPTPVADSAVGTCAALLSQGGLILPSRPAAPPDYSSVVTEEEAEQQTSRETPCEDLSGILGRPLMAFVQEFRFRPPPVYSEVSVGRAQAPLTGHVGRL